MEKEVNPSRDETPAKKLGVRHHIHHSLIHTLAGIVCAFAVLSTVFFWNLAKGPVDAAPIIPVLEKIIGNPERMRFDIGSLTLVWHSKSDPLGLQMENVHLLGPKGEFMAIKRIDVGVSVWRLLLADLHFTYAKAQDLSLKLIRLEDGSITLTGIENEEKQAESVTLQLDNIVKDLPSVTRLGLSGMRVIFEDRKEAMIRKFDDVSLEMTEERSFGKRSINGYVTLALTGINDGSLATVDFIYDGDDKTLESSIRLDNADTRKLIGGVLRAAGLPMIDMLVEGRAEIRLNNNLSLDFLKLKLKGNDGMLYWPRNYGRGLENQKLTNFDIDIGFTPETQNLTLTNAEITMKGITLKIAGQLSALAGWDKLKGDISANIPVLAVDALPAVWPKIWDVGARHWLVDRMDKGRLANIAINVPFTANRTKIEAETEDDPEYEWDVETGTIKGGFDFTGVTVDYRAPMLPAQNTTGKGVYEGLSLTLDIAKADIGKLHVSKGRLFFDDLITAGTGKADLDLSLHGPVASVFEYLEKEPISYRRKVDIDGTKAKGTADVELFTTFPTTKDMRVEDVKVKADAQLHNLVMPNAVKGMTLAGDAFTLEASENHFKIDGTGTLDGQPATLLWHELFSTTPKDAFATKLEADITTDKPIRERFIGSLEKRVDGIIPARISMLTKPDGHGTVDVTATLDAAKIDLTNPFNTVKEKGAKATATVKGSLQNGYIQSLDALSIKGDTLSLASGKITFARDANNEPVLATATLNGLRAGNTNANLDASWKNENNIKASVTGAGFDARGVLGGDPSGTGNTTPTAYDITIKTDKLYIANTPLENVTGAFVGNPDGSIVKARMDGMAAGAPVKLDYSSAGLLLESPNAGAALAALGVTERIRDGKLTVSAKPMSDGQSGDMKGSIVVENFSAVKAPVLAKLINLLSLPGILGILSQDTGLRFTRAESDMIWLNRAGGALLQLKDGRTSGASLGLTFEGEINLANDTMAIQGTAIPMSEINGLVSNIPIIGDILTGGKSGAIFAATYTMKGPSADPDVTVNPLSVLTPGILRRILFESGSTKTDKPLTKDKTK